MFDEQEINPAATVKKYLTVQTEGKQQVSREVEHDELDVIIADGRSWSRAGLRN